MNNSGKSFGNFLFLWLEELISAIDVGFRTYQIVNNFETN
jgi:hypothetical protein